VIRQLNAREIERIYHLYTLETFPAEELEPWERILPLCQQERFTGFGFFHNEELAAYALLSFSRHSLILLDLLETLPSLRGQGYGSRLVQFVKEHYSGQPVFIEVEDPAHARCEAEKNARQRRVAFYQRLGACPSGLQANLGGFIMLLLVLNCSPNSLDLPYVKKELSDHYADIYGPKAFII
jgi:GNAT superfamily N-acetyltransferase